ncbi:MAG: hypothetical protein QW041_03015 [Candidatus Pacearchaeota archaeon]
MWIKNFGRIIAIFLIAVALLSITAVAVVTYADWQDNNSSKTINKNEIALFDVALFSVSPPLYYSIKMYDPNGNLVKTWYDNEINNDGFVELIGLEVRPDDITISGDYSIIVSSNDNNGDSSYSILTLTIINSAPIIEWIHVPSEIYEGDIVYTEFYASDPDNDSLSYTIYRNGILVSNTNSNSWQTDIGDAGVYNYTFEVSDGEDIVRVTRTVVVNSIIVDSKNKTKEVPETLILARDIEVTSLDNFLKIRNKKSQELKNFEIKIIYIGINSEEKYKFNFGRNEVVFKELSANLEDNKAYLARIEVNTKGMKDSGYLIIRK